MENQINEIKVSLNVKILYKHQKMLEQMEQWTGEKDQKSNLVRQAIEDLFAKISASHPLPAAGEEPK